MKWNYRKKTALVTGASSGIGEVFAHELAKKGCNLILVARTQERLEQLARVLEEMYTINAVVIPMDLGRFDAAGRIAQEVSNLGLSVDILINNAGFGTLGRFNDIPQSRLIQEIQLNIGSLTELTHLFIGGMCERKDGVIVSVASMTAFQPTPFMAVYGATKAYILSFTEALWAEYRESGVRIVALCPGETKSSFHAVSGTECLNSKRMEPIEVVNAAFDAVEKDRSSRIVGINNNVMALLSRFLPRRVIINVTKNIFQPALENKQISADQ
ncbi:SDR family NAD(P)-dependent oxidoreductase [Bacillus horti]|uniref:Short-subunit dehydrogenase n=1 Tax=Caldalkalibacillus horti TaxID=77523 RepID=A0ABT9VX71_9BACI|nr:SDR family oxidoreductase [Bacillus horti]MDQ0165593.1 short-subunit dehydrogenase [Bacillus horti]